MLKNTKLPLFEDPLINNISTGGYEEKPRLTENEKKANHIASEQKRRQAIRDGFDRLTNLVPGLENQGRSESLVLRRTVDFIRIQLGERERLIKELEGLGQYVEECYKT